MAIGLAFRAFFQVLFRKEAAKAVQAALDSASGPAPIALPQASSATDSKASSDSKADVAKPSKPIASKATGRSDALTLLSTLQREARFLDLVGESLDGFDDAQVGAAARQVLSDVRKTLDRMFAITPLESRDEGEAVDIPRPASPVRMHVVGRAAETATRGTIVHRGWKADRCQTPTWNGASDDALILSPAEIEVDG